jgi:YegS/Rv2252/BmrU family lipid kinase
MNEGKKLLFIVNKYSGVGYQPQLEGKIIDACKMNDVECSIEFTKGPGHATELAEQAKEKFDCIIAVGGDGTVNEVARGLVHSATLMGILPKGSGNGLARHIGLSMKLENALQQLLTGVVVRMDTFVLNNKMSVNVSGIGFDGHIANLFSTGTKRGFYGYAKLTTREFFSFQEFPIQLELENQVHHHDAFMIAIANSAQYGNNAWISPSSSIVDRKLQLVIVKKIPLYRGPFFGYKMFSRQLGTNSLYQSIDVENAILKTPHPVAFHIDGEPSGHASHFEIKLQRESLNMIIPSDKTTKV